MTDYFVDDGGDNSDGLDWGGAYTSIQALQAAHPLTSAADRVIIGADSNCTQNSGALTLTGPSSGAPIKIISSTAGSGTDTTVAYAVGTGNQIYGDAAITFDGSFALYGIKTAAGGNILLSADSNEQGFAESCTFSLGNNGVLAPSYYDMSDITIVVNDTATAGNGILDLSISSPSRIRNVSFSGTLTHRNDRLITGPCGELAGIDLSGFTNAGSLVGGGIGSGRLIGIKTKTGLATWDAGFGTYPYTDLHIVNCGSTDNPAMLGACCYTGQTDSDATVYISGGATVEEVTDFSWRITTFSACSEVQPTYTPWLHGVIASAGSKTFSMAITSDPEYTDAEVWLEVQVMSTADSPLLTSYSDWRGGTGAARGSLATAGTAQPTDGTSSWTNGKTNQQTLAVGSVTVNEPGLFRARVCCAVASIDAANEYIYVNPKVTVT